LVGQLDAAGGVAVSEVAAAVAVLGCGAQELGHEVTVINVVLYLVNVLPSPPAG
jgi:hypothetical protein